MAQVTEVGSLEEEQVWGEVRWKSVSFELAEMEIHERSIHAGLRSVDRIKVTQNEGLSWRRKSGSKHGVKEVSQEDTTSCRAGAAGPGGTTAREGNRKCHITVTESV